ncbi:MAG: CHAP domain-containing protein [Cyanobacteria bacterium P01_A01_bin.80]
MKLSKQNVGKFVEQVMKPSKAIGLLIVSTATGMIQFASISAAKADDFMNTYFRNGQVIKLVTHAGHNVNLPYSKNGGMINTFEPDGTNDWKFVVIRTNNGVKFKKIGTNYLITAQKFPSHDLAPLEAYKDVEGEDKYQTWIPTPSNKPGFFNICLLAQQDQCMNVPGSKNRTKLTTFKRDLNDQDQMFSAVVLETNNPTPQPAPTGQPDFGKREYRQDNPLWKAGFAPKSVNPPVYSMSNPNAKGNCTWYASGRAKELGRNASNVNKLVADAGRWDNQAREKGILTSKTPQVGAIAQWEAANNNGFGHVAVVERVNGDGTILISESSYALSSPSSWDFLYRTRTISANEPSTFILP